MAGIYLHIPFCRKACHYCDFHFSTNLSSKSDLLACMHQELTARKNFLTGPVETIYFGGGTPSLLSKEEIISFLELIGKNYEVNVLPEITLEANPDDLSPEYLIALKEAGVNRLSIGVQSFVEKDLVFLNRSHDSTQAVTCIVNAKEAGFENISVDLMFGLPGTDTTWLQRNLTILQEFNVPHVSVYGLTVEERTALADMVRKGKVQPVSDASFTAQFSYLMDKMESAGYIQYEISNFGKEGYFSRHNSSYWKGIPYLGAGPGAHSYDGKSKRCWNVRNNHEYIRSIRTGNSFSEVEILGVKERVNEILLTGLRTIWGADLNKVEEIGGGELRNAILKEAQSFIDSGQLQLIENKLFLTRKGKLISDRISSDLFII